MISSTSNSISSRNTSSECCRALIAAAVIDYFAPKPKTTAGIVRTRILKSSPSDHLSMYSRSSFTQSLKSFTSLRPLNLPEAGQPRLHAQTAGAARCFRNSPLHKAAAGAARPGSCRRGAR